MQNFVKKYNQFINEGAQLGGPNFDIVKLNWLDDKKAPLEVLKSNNSHDVTGFRKIGTTSGVSFQVYYGLTIDPTRNRELGDSEPVFKLTLDALKQANIDGSTRALAEFIKPTAREIRAKKSRSIMESGIEAKQLEFIDFLVSQYVESGVEELEESKRISRKPIFYKITKEQVKYAIQKLKENETITNKFL